MSLCMWLFFSHTACSPKSCTSYSNSKNMQKVRGSSATGTMCRNSVGQELTTWYQHGWHKIQNDGAGTFCGFLEVRTGDEKHIFTHTYICVPMMVMGYIIDWLEMTQNGVLYIKNFFFTSGWSERLRNSSEDPARAWSAFCFSCFHSLSICSHCNFSVSSKHWKQ